MQYLIDPNGKFAGALTGTADEIIGKTPLDHTTTILPPPRSTDYWNGTEWVAIGAAPNYYYEFNYATKQWEDTRELQKAKDAKWDAIKLQRNQLEFGGFTHLGKTFDSDQISQIRIIAAAVLGQPITWTVADDTTLELDAEQVHALGVALGNHVNATHARGRAARQLIESAQTNAEVDSILL